MRKIALTGLALVILVAAAVAWAAEPPETITIKDCAKKKAPVEFPHKAHFEVTDCVTCHHTQKDLTAETVAKMDVATCGSCHITPEKEGTPECSQMSTKKNPFHILCLGCHKDKLKKNAELKVPTKCSQCHRKPKG